MSVAFKKSDESKLVCTFGPKGLEFVHSKYLDLLSSREDNIISKEKPNVDRVNKTIRQETR